MDCPKCNSNKIFKANHSISRIYRKGIYEYKYVDPRYQCLECSYKFDTIEFGEILVRKVPSLMNISKIKKL